ncbi:hypothetical protein J6590_033652 [Homalodisca vitripennis]|nr:hypothetical protein J6590_033652 [Homalodisca vitripennis]
MGSPTVGKEINRRKKTLFRPGHPARAVAAELRGRSLDTESTPSSSWLYRFSHYRRPKSSIYLQLAQPALIPRQSHPSTPQSGLCSEVLCTIMVVIPPASLALPFSFRFGKGIFCVVSCQVSYVFHRDLRKEALKGERLDNVELYTSVKMLHLYVNCVTFNFSEGRNDYLYMTKELITDVSAIERCELVFLTRLVMNHRGTGCSALSRHSDVRTSVRDIRLLAINHSVKDRFWKLRALDLRRYCSRARLWAESYTFTERP